MEMVRAVMIPAAAGALIAGVIIFGGCLSPLHRAARQGRIERLAEEISGGAKIESRSRQGLTALMWAAHFDHKEACRS